jgi:putative ABC transport system permease protein
MTPAARSIDDLFHNSPQPTKSESEKAFQLDFIATLGNVKAFLLSICGAVVFTTLLVCANTMAMSIRERTREVAVLRTLGYTRPKILAMLLGESVTLSLMGGMLGALLATLVTKALGRPGVGTPASMHMTFPTAVVVLFVATIVGIASALIPSYRASHVNIVEGLRHIG